MKAALFLLILAVCPSGWCVAREGLEMNIKMEVEAFLDNTPEEQWHVRDISDWYQKWLLPNEHLVRIIKYTPKKFAIVHLDGKGNGVILNSSGGIHRLSSILSHRLKQFPDDAWERLLLMRRIVELHFDPLCDVGSEKLFAGGGDNRLRGSAENRAVLKVLFKKYCRDPVFSLNHEGNRWNAEFFIFKPSGAVDKVTTSGQIDPFSLESVSSEKELKAGTFSWPTRFGE